MTDWRIKDNEIICFNILSKLMNEIPKEKQKYTLIKANTKRIMKHKKCDKLTALKEYKAELQKELDKRLCNQ